MPAPMQSSKNCRGQPNSASLALVWSLGVWKPSISSPSPGFGSPSQRFKPPTFISMVFMFSDFLMFVIIIVIKQQFKLPVQGCLPHGKHNLAARATLGFANCQGGDLASQRSRKSIWVHDLALVDKKKKSLIRFHI